MTAEGVVNNWIDRMKSGWTKSPGSNASGVAEAAPVAAPPPVDIPVREARPPKKASPRPTAPAFPRFQSTAGDQLAGRLVDRFANIRIRLRNAFTPSQPIVEREMFAGRTEVLTTLISSIEDQRLHTIIYGERGIGKTSLLHVLAQAARDARYIVGYVSCSVSSNFDDTFRAVAAEIPLLFHSGYGPTTTQAEQGATLADVLPPGPVSVRLASELVSKIVGTRVILILDEFDRSERDEFRRNIAEFMKKLSDRSSRLQMVIAGIADDVTELVEHVPSIRRNVFALQVPKMTDIEVRQLVKNGEDSCGVAFDEAATKFIVSVALGLPYVASLISHHAGLIAIDEGRLKVTKADVSVAIAEALGELNGRISKRSQLQIASTVRQGVHKILGALSGSAQLSGGRFNMDDITALYSSPEDVARCKAIVENLASNGVLIEAVDGDYGRTYRFIEESVPSYLWLLAAQSRFVDNPDQAHVDAALDPLPSLEG
jgi:Cdc6-like AAA superfamily ATPase